MSVVLEVKDLTVNFGGVRAVDGVSFDVSTGQRLALIGPNGAGKTTVLNAISRLVPAAGSLAYCTSSGTRVDLFGCRPHGLRQLGIARTFQSPQLIDELSIAENVRLGSYGMSHQDKRRAEHAALLEDVMELCGLEQWASMAARDVPHGIRKLTDLARSLVQPDQLLLLDEPGAGLGRAEKAVVAQVLQHTSQTVATLVVDHDMDFITDIVDTIAVMDFGELIISGDPRTVLDDVEVRRRYFGM